MALLLHWLPWASRHRIMYISNLAYRSPSSFYSQDRGPDALECEPLNEWIHPQYLTFFTGGQNVVRSTLQDYTSHQLVHRQNSYNDAIIPFHSIPFPPIYLRKVYIFPPHHPPYTPTPLLYRLSAGFCVLAFGFRGSFLNSSAVTDNVS